MFDDAQVRELLILTEGTADQEVQGACPACVHWNFSATRKNGKLLWNCFRATCGERGAVYIPGGGYSTPRYAAPPPAGPVSNPYTGTMSLLSDTVAQRLCDRFDILYPGFIQRHVYAGSQGRYLLPIYGPNGKIRGEVLRWPWIGAEYASGGALSSVVPYSKSLTFRELTSSTLLSWYKTETKGVMLVEDQMSAIKLASEGISAAALLGTTLSQDKIMELQRHTNTIALALDKDATSLAFKLARKWQHAFLQFKVVILEKDIKDMPRKDLRGLLYN